MNMNQAPFSWLSVITVALGIACAEFSTNVTAFLLPTLREHFVLSNHEVSWAVAIGLIGVGFSGLFYGVVSDMVGRRKIYLISLLIYMLGTLGMVLADQFEWFLMARFLQGIGSGSAWVIGTAILRDQAQDEVYRKQMSFLHVSSGVVRGLCPIVGAAILVGLGWSANYWLLVALACFTSFLFFCFQQETVELKVINKHAFVSRFVSLASSNTFKQFLIIKVLCVMAIFIMLAKLPLILDALAVSHQSAGNLQGLMFLCFIVGTLLGEWGVQRISLVKVMVLSLVMGLIASFVMLFNTSLMVDLMAYGLCFVVWGLVFSNATTQVVGARPEACGLASSLMMFLEMTLGGLAILVTNIGTNPTFVSCAYPVFILLALALWFGGYRYQFKLASIESTQID